MKNTNEPLIVQYELVWKNIEYLDDNILKIVGLYGVLIGAFLSKFESFYNKVYSASLLVFIVSFIFVLLLKRTASMIKEQVETLLEIEKAMELENQKIVKNAFASNFSKGLKISLLSIISIIILSFTLIISLSLKLTF